MIYLTLLQFTFNISLYHIFSSSLIESFSFSRESLGCAALAECKYFFELHLCANSEIKETREVGLKYIFLNVNIYFYENNV